jgi:hypothetical protein
MRPATAKDALDLLADLGAPRRLLRHAELVGEAAEALLAALAALGIEVDRNLVATGVVLHDTGKVIHAEELSSAGNLHESAGERLLLERGVSPELARICRSHSQWASMATSFEELIVALADKLWKGVRHPELEARMIAEAAARRGLQTWDVFIALDDVFEGIAAGGDGRLARSAE